MRLIKTKLPDVNIVEVGFFGDYRGWFVESYSRKKFLSLGIDINFIQDNHSFSAKKGTIRGLHFQKNPMAQIKLVRCTRGAILDVVVDLRKESPTYKEWLSTELSEYNHKQLLVPKGFAHGFVTLTDNVEVQYKVDEYYSPEHERGIRYDDPELNIDWGTMNPILSEKDLLAPLLQDSDINFSFYDGEIKKRY